MADIIQLLPDAVANQIAAGEVIQRPASVVKELVENAIDAGGTSIKLNIKDAGRTLVQVIDNGCGMSETDARMAFERHATSKIQQANDLFAIRTMGFRGEAMASIAAVAEVDLKTKLTGNELGTQLLISGSNVLKQEPVSCANGTNISVKNLFYNVPARRKFLKSNTTEFRHIVNELQRVALANPDLAFSLYHNDTPVYELPKENLKKRIVRLIGKSINNKLIPIDVDTSIVKISGYVGQPQHAKKKFGEQFFFVNKRYMRHPFFHKAVMRAYEKLIPGDTIPAYFIYFETDPSSIDINIHPTKTEIKFEDEGAIFQFIVAVLRESLGKFNEVPSIDFDQRGSIDIPVALKSTENLQVPEIKVNLSYNPFKTEGKESTWQKDPVPEEWQKLYAGLGNAPEKSNATRGGNFEEHAVQQSLMGSEDALVEMHKENWFLQFKGRYIMTPVKSGLMVIDQKRAHERILFENILTLLKENRVATQQQLFPQTIELDPADTLLLKEIIGELQELGFDIGEFGKNTFVINGTPGILENVSPGEMVIDMLEAYKNSGDIKEKACERAAVALASASAIGYGKVLEQKEMQELIDNLFACEMPNFSPAGKPAIQIIPTDDFERKFK